MHFYVDTLQPIRKTNPVWSIPREPDFRSSAHTTTSTVVRQKVSPTRGFSRNAPDLDLDEYLSPDPHESANTAVLDFARLASFAPTATSSTPEATYTPPREDEAAKRFESITAERVQLIIAKYAESPQAAEIAARLEMLNRRLLSEWPRVTNEQLSAAEETSQKLEALRDRREALKRRLGIEI